MMCGKLLKAAEKACAPGASIHHEAGVITPGKVLDAMLAADAMGILKAYDFPGNVRELANIVERGVAIATGNAIETAHLPDDLRELSIRTFRKKEGRLPSLDEQERDYIQWVLQEAGGNQTLAAQILGIDRVSLWRKLKRYQME